MAPFTVPSRVWTNRCIPRIASDELAFSLLVLDAWLEQERTGDCGAHQGVLDGWARTGLSSETDLFEWLQESFPREHGRSARGRARRRFDAARGKAERRRSEGVAVVLPGVGIPPPNGECTCPRVLFAAGHLDFEPLRAAVFNSRKPNPVLPHDRWLAVLRRALHEIHSEGAGFVSSFGTLTYDLVTTHAMEHSAPLLLVLVLPISQALTKAPRHSIVTCIAAAVRSPAKAAMVCRDRLIAALADLHCLIDIRSKGNLWTVLDRQQAASPKRQWIFVPERRNAQTEGNFQLLEKFPQWATPILEKELEIVPETAVGDTTPPPTPPSVPQGIVWSDYLYHYSRSRPGPWPGQDRKEYLLQLLEGDLLSGHTALDTLIRILLEKRVRASRELVRGTQPVVSWTRRQPQDLAGIRRWNRALIRWTFEPYGIAVKRTLLLKKGTRPVIYAPDSVYERLEASHRFRFQKHEPPRSSWKAEREWRLAGDLSLNELSPGDGFVFVPGQADVKYLKEHVQPHLPVVAIEAERF